MMNNPNRRALIKGGLFAAAASPVLAETGAATSHPTYPLIGHRAVISGDVVVGLSACSAIGQVAEPPAELGEGMDFSEQLIGRLVWMSYLSVSAEPGPDVDPRTLPESAANELRNVTRTILVREAGMMEVLQGSRFYWVETNPVPIVFLYSAIGVALYPFFHGFLDEAGREVFAWLKRQIVGDG